MTPSTSPPPPESLEDKLNQLGDNLTRNFFEAIKPWFPPFFAAGTALVGHFGIVWRHRPKSIYRLPVLQELAPLFLFCALVAFVFCFFWKRLTQKQGMLLHFFSLLSLGGGLFALSVEAARKSSFSPLANSFYLAAVTGSALLMSLVLFRRDELS